MIGLGLNLGLGSNRIAATPAAGSTDNVIVSTTSQMPTATSAVANNFTSRRSDWTTAQGAVTNIRCIDYRNYIDNTGLHAGGDRTIKRYLEYPANVFHQVTWNNGAATTIALNATNTSYTSDAVISSVTGLPLEIPEATQIWWRTVNVTGSTVSAFPVIVRPANCDALGLDDGNSTSDLGNSGTIDPAAGPNTFGPNCVIGTVAKANARGFLTIGDSLVYGTGDVSSVGAGGSSSWLHRGINQLYGSCKIAAGGQTAQTLLSPAASSTFKGFLARCGFTDAVYEAGINDLSGNSRTPAQILADRQTFYTVLKANNLLGDCNIWPCTLTARTDSTDSYATTTNQTPRTDGTYGQVNTFNASVRAGETQAAGFIEAMGYDATTLTSVIHDGPFPPVLDGVHFTSAKAAAMGDLLAADL